MFLGRDYSQGRNYSENIAAEIDGEVREIIESGYETAKQILQANMSQLNVVAEYLIRHEKIEGEDFAKLMRGELNEINDEELRDDAEQVFSDDEVKAADHIPEEKADTDNNANDNEE